LYSLAVIAYEMLAGEPPFDARSTSDILYKQVHETPPSILLKRPDLSPAVGEVFDRALAKQPERRYWSGTTFVTSLVGALEDQTSVAAAAAIQKPSIAAGSDQEPTGSTPAKRSAWVWIAGGALILALLLVGALAYTGVLGRSEPTPTFDVVALLTTVPNPVSTMTPTVGSASDATKGTPPPNPTALITPTEAPVPTIGPGSLATVRVPVADVRAQASQGSELVTQVIMGDKVRVQEMSDSWYRVVAIDQPSPKDPQGYPGWIEAGAVSPRVDEQGQLAIVIVPAAPVRVTASNDGQVIHTLSFDSRLALKSANDAWVAVALPDGQEGWVARDQVRLVCPEQGCASDVAGEPSQSRTSNEIVKTAQQFLGTRYLWGGTSASAFDCSGFIYRVFHANGITVPRDSLPMSQSGTWVEREELQPGDIIFTATGGPSGRVSHCALYLGDGQVLTTVGTDPIAIVPLDTGRYRDEYWGARRYP
jgi:cell wall-associated NlpC family hydrolase